VRRYIGANSRVGFDFAYDLVLLSFDVVGLSSGRYGFLVAFDFPLSVVWF